MCRLEFSLCSFLNISSLMSGLQNAKKTKLKTGARVGGRKDTGLLNHLEVTLAGGRGALNN